MAHGTYLCISCGESGPPACRHSECTGVIHYYCDSCLDMSPLVPSDEPDPPVLLEKSRDRSRAS